MNQPYRIGLVGCGLRGAWLMNSFRQARMPFELVAVADPDVQFARISSRIFAGDQASIFTDGRELLDSTDDLDAVVIASPNHVHRETAVKAMNAGVKCLLEKPVAASVADMAKMWEAHILTSQEPVLGFCIRYMPFYRRIQEICASGALGKILVIDAEELMADDLSVVFARGDWRPKQSMSGGLMAEKCSHDMDMLNWLVGSKPQLVSSFAARTFLNPRPQAAENCRDCNLTESCRFVHGSVPEIYEAAWPAELREVLQKLQDDTCVFSARHTYPDHQILNIQYENGVLCNFSVTQCQPANRRTIHVLGSDARLYGVVNDNEFRVYRRDTRGGEVIETYKVTPDQSGHNGGDSVLTKDFFDMLSGLHNPQRPGLREGIEASLLSLAADESAETGRPVALDSLRQRVYLEQASSSTVTSIE